MNKEFICAHCGGAFLKENTDDEQAEEYRQIFEPLGYAPFKQEDKVEVCHECWLKVVPQQGASA